jgi:dTDP-4-dehydrorhamnose 3,5-epimerase
MRIKDLAIPDVKEITFNHHADNRGCFYEVFGEKYQEFFGTEPTQDNISETRYRGTCRGMHWQSAPHAQGKLVTVLNGAVYDLVIDLRPDSKTFGASLGVIITGNKQLWVPPGFGHGFQTLTDHVKFHYKCTSGYSKEHERSLNIMDPIFDGMLPYDVTNISDKDKAAPNWGQVCESINEK